MENNNVKTYCRNNQITGVWFGNRKFRFKTLGIDKNQILELDQSKDKKEKEEKTIDQSKDSSIENNDIEMSPENSDKQIYDQQAEEQNQEITTNDSLSETNTEEQEIQDTPEDVELDNSKEEVSENTPSQEEQNEQELGDIRAQAEIPRDQDVDLGR